LNNDISSGVEYDPKVIIKVFLMEQGKPNGLLPRGDAAGMKVISSIG
jgi:hypothetical protein